MRFLVSVIPLATTKICHFLPKTNWETWTLLLNFFNFLLESSDFFCHQIRGYNNVRNAKICQNIFLVLSVHALEGKTMFNMPTGNLLEIFYVSYFSLKAQGLFKQKIQKIHF